jgi:hypothetical protein
LPALKENATIIVNKKHLEKLIEKSPLIRGDLEGFNFLTPEIDDKYDNTYLL